MWMPLLSYEVLIFQLKKCDGSKIQGSLKLNYFWSGACLSKLITCSFYTSDKFNLAIHVVCINKFEVGCQLWLVTPYEEHLPLLTKLVLPEGYLNKICMWYLRLNREGSPELIKSIKWWKQVLTGDKDVFFSLHILKLLAIFGKCPEY
jgi:hypothetical protein